MMEGVSSEAASLAGHLRLSNLCWIYDNNHITIEGNTALAFTEDVATRFIGYGWNVTPRRDANDLEMLSGRSTPSAPNANGPTLVIVDSHIAYGSPTKQDTQAHTANRSVRKRCGSPSARTDGRAGTFLVPEGVESTSRRASGVAASICARVVRDVRRVRGPAPLPGRRDPAHAEAQLPDGWDGAIRHSNPTRRTRRDATLPPRCRSDRGARAVADRGIGRSVTVHQDATHLRRRRESNRPELGGRNLHFGIREHRWPRS